MKSCPKCGVQLPDEAVFCNNCGANLAADPQPIPAPQAPINPAPINNATLESAKEKNKNTKVGMIAIIAAAAVVFLLLIIFVCTLLGGGGYKKPIKNVVNSMNSEKVDMDSYITNFLPGYAVTAYNDVFAVFKGSDIADDFVEEANEDFEDQYDYFCDEYGDDFKITYEIKKAKKLDSDDIEDLEENWQDLYDTLDDYDLTDEDTYEDLQDYLDDYYDYDLSDSDAKKLCKIATTFMDEMKDFHIQAAYEVKLKLAIKGEDDSDHETVTINVIKVNGTWIIDPLSGDSFGNDLGLYSLLYSYSYY